ncbi:MAG: hypothetical protein RUDDFDWM_001057 [Candidatus Fervidibacterota bacterium]
MCLLVVGVLSFLALSDCIAETTQALEGFWRLDEGEGAIVHDVSGKGRHGKITRAKWVKSEGKEAFALEFDGLLSFVDIDGKELQFADEVTMMAWVNPSDLSSEGAFISLGREHPSSGYHFLHGPGGTLRLLIASEKRPRVGAAVFVLTTKPVLKTNEWQHVAATYSALKDEAAIFLNGELVARSKAEGKIVYYAVWGIQYPPLTIGDRSHQKPFWSFDGFMRNVRLYSRALSPEEVKAIYAEEAHQIKSLKFVPSRVQAEKLPCRLFLEVIDADTGKPTQAKVFVTDKEGNGYYPPEAYERGLAYGLLQREKAFYTDGRVAVPLSEGNFVVRVTKGYEFLPAEAEVSLKSGEEKQLRVTLKRLVNMQSLGWLSGEHHMHCTGHGVQKYDRVFANPKTCLPTLVLILKSEGLHYAFMTPHGLKFGETYVESDFLLHSSNEWGSGGTGGDICLIGFKTMPKRRNIFDNISAFVLAQEQGWVALHTHPDWGKVSNPKDLGFARDLPIVVAYGWSPVWDLFCWVANEEKLQWWYRWLNLGFRLGITGSTDTYFNNPRSIISPGFNRTYVRANSLTLEAIVDGYRKGKTFATTGPLLIFQVKPVGAKDWFDVGDIVRLHSQGQVEVRLRCWAIRGLGRMEIVKNGVILHSFDGKGEKEKEISLTLPVSETCWLAVRCFEANAKDVRQGFAHTSPIYVQVGNMPMKPKDEDINFFVQWLEDYEKVIPAIAKDVGVAIEEAAELLAHIQKAKAIYTGLREKPRRWTD